MYRVAMYLLQQPDWWGNITRVTDALTVLLLTWNASFYRYSGGYLNGDRLENCLRDNWDEIERFHDRDIMSFVQSDKPEITRLFNCFLNALRINTSKTNAARLSPVGAAKALHLLAPNFFPIWDGEIARRYGCGFSQQGKEAGTKYVKFLEEIRVVAAALQGPPLKTGKTLVKQIDEYNYAKFSKGWI